MGIQATVPKQCGAIKSSLVKVIRNHAIKAQRWNGGPGWFVVRGANDEWNKGQPVLLHMGSRT
jgi:hypothetical protein